MYTLEAKRRNNKAWMSRQRQAWIAAGLCSKCGGAKTGKKRACEGCLQKQRDKAQIRVNDRAAAGRCYRCNSVLPSHVNRDVQYTQCPTCFFKHIAQLHLGSRDQWMPLAELFDQQKGRCAYTDEPLILGRNTSLDHILPKARGGTNDIANLQWVTKTVNDIKRDLTHDEFVAICRVIARRADGAT